MARDTRGRLVLWCYLPLHPVAATHLNPLFTYPSHTLALPLLRPCPFCTHSYPCRAHDCILPAYTLAPSQARKTLLLAHLLHLSHSHTPSPTCTSSPLQRL